MKRHGWQLRILVFVVMLFAGFWGPAAFAKAPADPAEKLTFRVKYILDGSVYLDAGRNANLREGMKIFVVHAGPRTNFETPDLLEKEKTIAELKVVSVADSSAVCEIVATHGDMQLGDVAYRVSDSLFDRKPSENAVTAATHEYPITVTFSDGDLPEDSEFLAGPNHKDLRRAIPRETVRIGLDYIQVKESTGMDTTQLGGQIRANLDNIGGTHWSLDGYWRGKRKIHQPGVTSAEPMTLTDVMNQTYTLGFYYENPNSLLSIGVGRVYLPGAPSLDTIDGGYLGIKVTPAVTIGVFGGSRPDTVSWNYDPGQDMVGTYESFDAGNFGGFHLHSTTGLAITAIRWRVARQFAFTENSVSLGKFFSFYNSLQIDAARVSPVQPNFTNTTGVSFTSSTLRFQPNQRFFIDLNHSYYVNLPTFDPGLISSPVFVKYLFQGLSTDIRYDVTKHIALSTAIGRNKSNFDAHQAWNKMYGVDFTQIGKTGINAGFRYASFNSSFGNGNFKAASLSRGIMGRLQFSVQGGQQSISSPLTLNKQTIFVDGSSDLNIGSRYFVNGSYGWYRGTVLNYRVMTTMFGYRFGGIKSQ